MNLAKRISLPLVCSLLPLTFAAQTIPTAIDAEVHKVMAQTHAKGLSLAVIDHGQVGYVQSSMTVTFLRLLS